MEPVGLSVNIANVTEERLLSSFLLSSWQTHSIQNSSIGFIRCTYFSGTRYPTNLHFITILLTFALLYCHWTLHSFLFFLSLHSFLTYTSYYVLQIYQSKFDTESLSSSLRMCEQNYSGIITRHYGLSHFSNRPVLFSHRTVIVL